MAVAGRGSEGLPPTVGVLDFQVILPPTPLLAQHPVGLVQRHKLAVQAWVGWVTVRVQLRVAGLG